jgi:hypothetical protein
MVASSPFLRQGQAGTSREAFDLALAPHMSAFGGKADIAHSMRNVCL